MVKQDVIDQLIARARAGDFLAIGFGRGFKAKGEAAEILRNIPELLDAYRAMPLSHGNSIALNNRKFWKFLETDANRKAFLQAVDESIFNLANKMPGLNTVQTTVYNNAFIREHVLDRLSQLRFQLFNALYK